MAAPHLPPCSPTDAVDPAPPRDTSPRLDRAVKVMAGLVVVGVGLYLVSPLVVTILCAAGVAIAVQPVGRFLRRHGVARASATASMIGIVLLATVAFGALVSLGAADLQDALPQIKDKASQTTSRLFPSLSRRGLLRLDSLVSQTRPDFSSAALLAEGVFSAASIVTGFGFTILVSVFMLLEAAGMERKLVRLAERWPHLTESVERSATDVQRYLFIKFIASLLTGLGAFLTCVAFDVPTPLTWGLLAFVLNFVPTVGSLFAAVPPIALALLHDSYSGLSVAVAYLLINLVIGNMLEPRVTGQQLGLSPLVVLLSVVLWGIVLGPVGALLSAPLTVVLRIFCSNSPRLEWVAVLLSPAPKPRWRRPHRPPDEPLAPATSAS